MKNFNTIWEEEIYGRRNHRSKYPYDSVVSFLYRNYPKNKPREEVKILEVGSGVGNNLWFAAREGFNVTGIEGSKTAVEACQSRFKKNNLVGEFVVGDFTNLPFENDTFDIVIDRGAIVCANLEAGKKAVNEAQRVLVKGGKFFFNPYSQSHTSFISGDLDKNGFVHNITKGLTGVGSLCFYSYRDVLESLNKGWDIESIRHREFKEVFNSVQVTYADWEAIVKKI